YYPDRLKYPLKRAGERGEGKWQRVSWDEALDTIADRLGDIRERHGSQSVAWVIEVMPYIRLACALEATMINPIGFGDAAGPCADQLSYGTQYGHLYTMDMAKPGMVVTWGSNQAETRAYYWRRIRDAIEGGARFVALDPRFTSTASKADEYIPIRPGTDAALALGMMNVIFAKGLEDRDFITQHTVGPFLVREDNGLFLREKDIVPGGSDRYLVWNSLTASPACSDERGVTPALSGRYPANGVHCKPAFQLLADLAEEYPLDKASDLTGIPAGTIQKLALDYINRKPVASYRSMGLQRTFHGDLSWRAVTALAAVTGNINLDGYSEGYRRYLFDNDTILFRDRFPRPLPLLQAYKAITAGEPYQIKALWIAGHNFMNQNPDSDRVINELVPKLEFIIVSDMFMTDSARYADVVLPASSFYEYLDVVTPLDILSPYIQLQPKVIEPLYESRPDRDIVNDLGIRMGLGEDFPVSAEEFVRRVLESGHPSMEGVTLGKLEKGPVEAAPYSMKGFATPSGRLEFYPERMKEFGQELPVYLEPAESARRPLAEIDPEPLLEMSPIDAGLRGIRDGDMVTAFNDRGRVKVRARVHDGISTGVVNINEGWWRRHFEEGSFQSLTHATINPAQMAVFEPNSAMYDNLVEVRKAGE
ncbi:MAG: molybdopterin-dependent oxidoreductase, partial [Dehalococcoidia bacterium]|nr:molybdopterin-dependent oxidoreductase [Dehalococcoidia bacterium]